MNEMIEAIKGYTEHPSEYTRELTELAQVLDKDFRVSLERYFELISTIKVGGYYFPPEYTHSRLAQVNNVYDIVNSAKMWLVSLYKHKEIFSEEFQELIITLYSEVNYVFGISQEILRQHFASLREELRKELDK